MTYFLIEFIHLLARVLMVVIVVDVLLSYFMSPYHSVRIFLDKVVNPILEPIRRVVPAVQSIDFSPIIAIVLIQIVEFLLVKVLAGL